VGTADLCPQHPHLKGFWDRKWRRVCEVIFQGDHWITGCGNHDTVRRGNQIDLDADINWNLGNTLPQVLNRAYNNSATLLWVHGFSPGLPMDFLNATLETPWGFFRNTDDRYGVKVVSEEVGFLDWEIEPELYLEPQAFPSSRRWGLPPWINSKTLPRPCGRRWSKPTTTSRKWPKSASTAWAPDGGIACEVPALEELNQPSLPRFLATLDVPKLKHLCHGLYGRWPRHLQCVPLF
jgi:hypothetical protein